MYDGTEGMTIGILLRGGTYAKIKSGIIVFVNSNNSCPMRGLPDDLQNLSYGSGRRGWTDRRVFTEWLKEEKCIPEDNQGRPQFIFSIMSIHIEKLVK